MMPQSLAHILDPPTHRPQIGLPLVEEIRVVEHEAHYPRAVRRRVADLTALQNGKLRPNSTDGVSGVCARPGDEMKRTGSLAVEPEIFGEGLRDAELEALFDEVADGPGIILEIARCEALIGTVEEREMLLGANNGGELSPLLAGEIHAGGVVGAGVQEHDATFWGLLDGGLHAGEVETLGLGGEVWVCPDGEVNIGEDLVVVCPCWGGEINGLVGGTRVKFGEEEGSEVDGAGAGNSLKADNLRRGSICCLWDISG
jgi:hypothetical protein